MILNFDGEFSIPLCVFNCKPFCNPHEQEERYCFMMEKKIFLLTNRCLCNKTARKTDLNLRNELLNRLLSLNIKVSIASKLQANFAN